MKSKNDLRDFVTRPPLAPPSCYGGFPISQPKVCVRGCSEDRVLSNDYNRCDPSTGKIDESNNIFSDLDCSKGLKMANLNINSLLKSIDQLRIIMQNSSIDILAINETKIDHSVSDDEISIPFRSENGKDSRT